MERSDVTIDVYIRYNKLVSHGPLNGFNRIHYLYTGRKKSKLNCELEKKS